MVDVIFDNKLFILKDSFGGTTKFTIDEFEYLVLKIENVITLVREENKRKSLEMQQQLADKQKGISNV